MTVAPHLVVLVYCPIGDATSAALETRFTRAGGEASEVLARNVQPLQVDEGKFNYRLVRAELELDDYGGIEAHCRIDDGPETVVPFSVLPPVA